MAAENPASAAEALEAALAEAQRLCAVEDDEEEPYKSKYAAADLLLAAIAGTNVTASSRSTDTKDTRDSSLDKSQATSTVSSANAASTQSSANGLAGGVCSGREPHTGVAPCPSASQYSSKAAAAQHSSHQSAGTTLFAPETDLTAMVAVLCARRGIALLDTDLREKGEADVLAALAVLEPVSTEQATLQEAYNVLGALHSSRGDFQEAIAWLEKAERLYARLGPASCNNGRVCISSGVHDSEESLSAVSTPAAVALADAAGPGGDQATDTSSNSLPPRPAVQQIARLESQYTSTVFFLAQVHAHAGHKDQSALYCAATLQRQLASGDFRLNEWVQNCLQLAGYYVGNNSFALGEHCLCAARKVAMLVATATPVLAAGTHLVDGSHNFVEESKAVPSSDAPRDADPGQPPSTSPSSHIPQGQTLPPQQQQLQAQLQGQLLEDDVIANLELAEAKLYLYRLLLSHDVVLEGKSNELPNADAHTFPAFLRFPMLELPNPSTYAWGSASLVSTFNDARRLFNRAMTCFKAALAYYQLDGWVTEHCDILMEMSNLWRCLAGFEPDPHRKCVMHKARAKLLKPLHGELNPQYYLGRCRSINLELGNIYRELLDIKDADDRPSSKVAAAGVSAVKYYQSFIDSFKDEAKQLPNRVDEESERYFLMASFSMGRVLHKASTGSTAGGTAKDIVALTVAQQHLRWSASYVRRHGLIEYTGEAGLAEELANLLEDKVALLQRLTVQQEQQKKLQS